MTVNLLCNVRTCRKPLSRTLWVTSCSHSFCEEHAKPLSQRNVKCPACDTLLGKRFDVIRQNANPEEEFKAMLLVGLRPEIVLDIATKAISFWNYQVEQELKFQSNTSNQLLNTKEKAKMNQDCLMKKLTSAKKQIESNEKQMSEQNRIIKQLRNQLFYREQHMKKIQVLLNTNSQPETVRKVNIESDKTHSDERAVHNAEFIFAPCITSREEL